MKQMAAKALHSVYDTGETKTTAKDPKFIFHALLEMLDFGRRRRE